jgi:hypothetical protein
MVPLSYGMSSQGNGNGESKASSPKLHKSQRGDLVTPRRLHVLFLYRGLIFPAV